MIDFLPQLAFFDIDGTLLGSSHQLSQRTITAIKALKSKGTKISLATGRPSFAANKIAETLEVDSWSLFFSGSLISNPSNKTVLHEIEIEKSLIYAAIQSAKELGLYVELYTKDDYFVETFSDLTPKHSYYIGFDPKLVKFEDIIETKRIIKILTVSEKQHEKQNSLIAHLSKLKCLCSTAASHPDIIFNNITALNANRIDGFYSILKDYNIQPEKVIAFGDASSDIDFLKLSGTGVAMGNSPDNVKQAANYLTSSAENDGVAEFIEQILKNI